MFAATFYQVVKLKSLKKWLHDCDFFVSISLWCSNDKVRNVLTYSAIELADEVDHRRSATKMVCVRRFACG